MEYTEEWVMKRRNRYHGLAPLRSALAEAGHPEERLKIIHVAGTNGKGSTCRFLHDILAGQGYTVGLFTSPHLVRHRDRIRISGEWIPEDEFRNALKRFENSILEHDLGMFEIDCLIAFDWFARRGVDYAIIEAGMGGRLDNTNVIAQSVLSVITTIAEDHTKVLGERIPQIAFEKAGIIKNNGRIVTGILGPQAEQVIRRTAYRRHAAYRKVLPLYPLADQSFRYDGDIYRIASKAQYQKHNAALALEAARMLGIPIHTAAVHDAVARSVWEGRFETVSEDPLIILDGAHNEEGIQALRKSMQSLPQPRIVVFSALSDKPFLKMLRILRDSCEGQIVTSFHDERISSLQEYEQAGYRVVPEAGNAIAEAVEKAGKGTVIITGSLHFISAVRESYHPL